MLLDQPSVCFLPQRDVVQTVTDCRAATLLYIKSSFTPQKKLQFKNVFLSFLYTGLSLSFFFKSFTLSSDQIYADGSTHSFLIGVRFLGNNKSTE